MGNLKLANKVWSAFLNLLTVYPDQPYGQPVIRSPLDGTVLCTPPETAVPGELCNRLEEGRTEARKLGFPAGLQFGLEIDDLPCPASAYFKLSNFLESEKAYRYREYENEINELIFDFTDIASEEEIEKVLDSDSFYDSLTSYAIQSSFYLGYQLGLALTTLRHRERETWERIMQILYLIFDYPHKHYTSSILKYRKSFILPRIYHD